MPFYTMPDGESLYVREQGQGQPVLILSGLGMQSWQWTPFIFPHFKNYRFIIPDWRGFGGSKDCKIPAGLDAIQSHWRDVDSLLSQMKLEQLIVVSYSMGATTAMHGMKYGDFGKKIKAYLHIDQTPKIASDDAWSYGLFGPQYPKFKQLLQSISDFLAAHQDAIHIENLQPEPRKQLVQLWLDFIQLQGSNKIAPLAFKLALNQPRLQKHILPIQRLDYLAWYINNYLHHNEDYRQAILNLPCPTTFFIGERSSLYPVQGQKDIAEGLKNAQSILFKRSGHTPLLTEPVKFGLELQHFLKQVS
ncbi:pimeloyl-ACP methyl ester carboxylesterase [Acinetobacter calcoaceticus]|uniref:Pimeloyl-ACP methyl ester carboxylesterase n=1 Tax=Acinetobacter calcoaceticus TaxID=471 RepID=A0A4R1XR40_ACICA|nr:pimeloyl-ACP methyl ester carboxylesterase [Acinetobacter calcoaceticus]